MFITSPKRRQTQSTIPKTKDLYTYCLVFMQFLSPEFLPVSISFKS